jgi:hypothetical protein
LRPAQDRWREPDLRHCARRVEIDDRDDGPGWLAALAPLLTEVLSGDLRLFYLLWPMAVEVDALEADETEPMPGIGPMTGALEAFTDFFGIDVPPWRAWT